MDFTAIVHRFDSKLWGYHFIVTGDLAGPFVTGKDRRVVCTLNDVLSFQCALMPKGNGSYFINLNKKIRDKLSLEIGDSIQVTLKKDDSKYGLPVPKELEALYEVDKEGKRLFHQLTPGKQRNLLYIVGTGKDEEDRIQKSITVTEHLKNQKGKIDFKKLYQELKKGN